jgi:hypothetical protein
VTYVTVHEHRALLPRFILTPSAALPVRRPLEPPAWGRPLAPGGEGPPIESDRRLKTHLKHAGETAEGLNLYRFRYIGEDREFRGVMAQELLADERHRRAVEVGADGYYRVHYDRLGLAGLATDEMRAAGERAARRAAALAH